jgi:hypothetical protein
MSRLFDAGGPVQNERAYMLEQFDEGRLLMVGTGALSRELPNVPATDLWRAISEALWILQKLNNVSQAFIDKMLHLLIHNLPIFDAGLARERDFPVWNVRAAQSGDFAATPDVTLRVEGSLHGALGPDLEDELVGTASALNQPTLLPKLMSNVVRATALAPDPANGDDWAPHTLHVVQPTVGALLGLQQQALGHDVRGLPMFSSHLDPNDLPVVNAYNRPFARDLNEVWACFSGRAAYLVYAYGNAPAAGVMFAPPPNWEVVPPAIVAQVGLGAHTPPANDSVWMRYIRPYVPGNNAVDDFDRQFRVYCVLQSLPVIEAQYPATYQRPPAGRLRRFDAGGVFGVGLTPAGVLPDIDRTTPRIARYLEEVNVAGTALEFLTVDGIRGLPNVPNQSKSLLVIRGFATAWDACHLGRTQNDAFRRWSAADRGQDNLTTVQDEYLLYLGGCRAHKYLQPAGGLWTLCYLQRQDSVSWGCPADATVEFLQDSSRLASFCLKLRCAVECADQLLRISNARVSSCREAYLYDANLWERVERGGVADPAQLTPDQYLLQQSTLLSCLFNHPHGSAMISFGLAAVGGLRLREPRVGGALALDDVRRMNWVVNQVLPNKLWAIYLGVAAPTFRMDRVGRRFFQNAKYTTQWVGISEEFKPGVMLDPQDEAWMAMLTTIYNESVDILTVSLSQFGQDLEVYVGGVRQRYSAELSPFAARLILPHETRLRRIGVNGARLATRQSPQFGDNQTWRADQDNLVTMPFQYDVHGFSQPAVPMRGAAIAGAIDVRSSMFCCSRVRLNRYEATDADPLFPGCRLAGGHYWMAQLAKPPTATPSFTPAMAALLKVLKPAPVLAAVGHDEDMPIPTQPGVGPVSANPASVIQPGTQGVGDLPVRERGDITLEQLVASLHGLDPEVQQWVTRSFLLRTHGTDLGAALTGASSLASSPPPRDRSAMHSPQGGDGTSGGDREPNDRVPGADVTED